MHRFIPSSGDALIAYKKLFPNADTTLSDMRVQPAFFAAGMHTFDGSILWFSKRLRPFRAERKYLCARPRWFMYCRSEKTAN